VDRSKARAKHMALRGRPAGSAARVCSDAEVAVVPRDAHGWRYWMAMGAPAPVPYSCIGQLGVLSHYRHRIRVCIQPGKGSLSRLL
jgi:hypothetical protein